MSTHTKSPIRTKSSQNDWPITPREARHCEDLHEGSAEDCTLCDRFELIEHNGFASDVTSWYDEVGQFIDSIHGSVGALR